MVIENQKELRDFLTSITPINEWEQKDYIKDRTQIDAYWKLCSEAKHIEIVGDYDTDGICSSYNLYKSLTEKYPDKDVRIRLPKRITEGYGISRTIINEIHDLYNNDKENTLIITVDNGISAGFYLNPLTEEGYKVCILDHHQLADGVNLPKVSLCIDPALDRIENPFVGDYWCATGIAYLICKDYVSEKLRTELETFTGIATVTDCMEVKEGNWAIIKKAINNVRAEKIPDSLKLLLKELKQNTVDCTEDTFGYYLGPCFNACSRIYDAADKMENFLLNPTIEEANTIKKINDERKELSDTFTELAVNKVKELGKENDYPLWLFYPDIPEGIVGIIAGHLSETFECPTILLTNTEMEDEFGNSIYKGSARSYGEFNIYEYLYANRDKLFKFGGHPGAAGLAVSNIYYEELSKQFTEKAPVAEDKNPIVIEIEPNAIPSYLNILETFRPFGQGRILPNFAMYVDTLHDHSLKMKFVGKQEEHISIEGPFGKYKILHFYHTDDNGKDSFYMKGKLTRSTFRGINTPTFIADICEDSYEHSKNITDNVEIEK